MSIYIPGMEIPVGNPEEPTAVWIYPDGSIKAFYNCGNDIINSHAIPVSDHGRLVDAFEMFVEFVIEGQRSKRYKLGERWELNGEEIRKVIDRLPTIIPAERGEYDESCNVPSQIIGLKMPACSSYTASGSGRVTLKITRLLKKDENGVMREYLPYRRVSDGAKGLLCKENGDFIEVKSLATGEE